MKTVRLQVDGKKIFAEEGTTILEAARQNGIDIPTLCYHPRLAPLGHCRICIVDVEGIEKPITSCDNPVAEGMVVTTTTPEIQVMRDQLLVLSLSTHPYKDCLTCERTGTCELQEKAYEFQSELPEQLETDIPKEKKEDDPYIVRDEEKCILCGRCLQVCRSGPGAFVYSFAGNGVNTRVIPCKDGKEVSLEEAGCVYCGQCVDVCPVAALTEKGRRAGGREWELSRAPGLCVECSLGCALERQAFGEDLIRVTVPREGEKVSWLCKKGKFGVNELDKEPLTAPLLIEGKQAREVGYDEAIKQAAQNLLDIKNNAGAEALAVLASGQLSNEESYLVQKLARGVMGTNNVDLGVEANWAKAYNKVLEIAGPDSFIPTPASMQYNEALFVIGKGLEETHPVAAMAVGQAARFGDARVIRIAGDQDRFSSWEELNLKAKSGAENALFEGIAAALQGGDPQGPAEKAGVSVDDLKMAAEQLEKPDSCIIVSSEFLASADDKTIDALLEMAKAGGKLEKGRSDLLLLSRFSNAAGMLAFGGSPAFGPGIKPLNGDVGLSREEVLAAVGKGKVKGVLAFGPGFAELKLGGLDFLAVSCSAKEEAPGEADLVLPALPIIQKTGSFTNSSGLTYINTPALQNGRGQKEDWQVICDLAREMGADWQYTSLEDVREAMEGLFAG